LVQVSVRQKRARSIGPNATGASTSRSILWRPRLPINDGELACDLPGPENGQDPLFTPKRSYDDFEKAPFEPVATVAGIPGGKKRVTGMEVTRFGARKQLSRQPFGQAGQYGLGG